MRISVSTRRLARPAAAIAALLILAGPASADPTPITSLTNATSPYSASDQQKIEAYAKFWTSALARAKDRPGEVRQIREKLLAPVTTGRSITPLFRETYSRQLRDSGLPDIVENGNGQTAVNALIVLSGLGTEDALSTLVRHTDPTKEERPYVRLSAARGAATLLQSGTLEQSPRKVKSAARDLLSSAENEQDGLTLQHLLRALYESEGALVTPADKEVARGYMVDAMARTTARAAAATEFTTANRFIESLFPVVKLNRDGYLNLIPVDPSVARSFGKSLAPVLLEIMQVALTHWDAAHRMRSNTSISVLIGLVDSFLDKIHSVIYPNGPRAPSTNLGRVWSQADLPAYREDLRRWEEVVKRY